MKKYFIDGDFPDLQLFRNVIEDFQERENIKSLLWDGQWTGKNWTRLSFKSTKADIIDDLLYVAREIGATIEITEDVDD
jgi:hypothetical protein